MNESKYTKFRIWSSSDCGTLSSFELQATTESQSTDGLQYNRYINFMAL